MQARQKKLLERFGQITLAELQKTQTRVNELNKSITLQNSDSAKRLIHKTTSFFDSKESNELLAELFSVYEARMRDVQAEKLRAAEAKALAKGKVLSEEEKAAASAISADDVIPGLEAWLPDEPSLLQEATNKLDKVYALYEAYVGMGSRQNLVSNVLPKAQEEKEYEKQLLIRQQHLSMVNNFNAAIKAKLKDALLKDNLRLQDVDYFLRNADIQLQSLRALIEKEWSGSVYLEEINKLSRQIQDLQSQNEGQRLRSRVVGKLREALKTLGNQVGALVSQEAKEEKTKQVVSQVKDVLVKMEPLSWPINERTIDFVVSFDKKFGQGYQEKHIALQIIKLAGLKAEAGKEGEVASRFVRLVDSANMPRPEDNKEDKETIRDRQDAYFYQTQISHNRELRIAVDKFRKAGSVLATTLRDKNKNSYQKLESFTNEIRSKETVDCLSQNNDNRFVQILKSVVRFVSGGWLFRSHGRKLVENTASTLRKEKGLFVPPEEKEAKSQPGSPAQKRNSP